MVIIILKLSASVDNLSKLGVIGKCAIFELPIISDENPSAKITITLRPLKLLLFCRGVIKTLVFKKISRHHRSSH